MKSKFLHLILLSVLVFLAACSPAATPEPAPTEPLPTATSTPEEVPQVDECVSCHTDKQRLIETAKLEEGGGEGESKGVG